MPDSQRSESLTRRTFLRLSAATAGLAATGGLPFLGGCADDIGPLGPEFDSGTRRTRGGRNPLFIPPTVVPSGLTLAAAPAQVDLGGGQLSNVWAYNGLFPGPTLEVNRGDRVTATLTNGLPDPTITHWHGMIIDDYNDGHPRHAFGPGGSFAYDFVVDQRACLNWYHPHPHELTGEQVALGLAGAFIIRDAEEAALGLPSREVPLVIRDADFTSGGDIDYSPNPGGYLGDTPLVNGTLNPRLEVERALYRFRILNGANARIFRLALSDGTPFVLIGNDGGLLETAWPLDEVTISNGERLDLVVDFRLFDTGTTLYLRDLNTGWDLLEFAVTGQQAEPGGLNRYLSHIPKLSDPVVTREFSFDGMGKINGQTYDVNRVDVQVPLGQTERWVFTTGGNAPHPVHSHAAPFQVQSRTGGRGQLYPWERGWKDTVLLEDGETVEVFVRFEAHRGLYLLHCHKLEHEDRGMMLNFEVV